MSRYIPYVWVNGETITEEKLNNLEQGVAAATSAVGHANAAATKSAMTDTAKVYVYTGNESGMVNGNWYYYDGTAWVSGGVYQASAVQTDRTLTLDGEAADAKATGDAAEKIRQDIEAYGAYDIWDGLLRRAGGTSHKVVYTWSGDVCTVTTPNGASDDYSANILISTSDLPSSVVPGETYYVRYTTTLGGSSGVRLRIIFYDSNGVGITVAYFSENGSVTIPANTARWHVSLFVGTGVTFAGPVIAGNIHMISAKTNRELEADTANLSDGLSKAVASQGVLAGGTDLDNVKTPGIWVLSSSYSYPHTPIPAGYGGLLCVFPASANSVGQAAYVMTSNMTMFHCYVRSAVGGSYLAWKQMDGMPSYGVLADNTDLDTLKMSGNWVLNSGRNYPHSPISSAFGGLLSVFPGSANSIIQTVIVLSKTNIDHIHMYVRGAVGGSFDTDGIYIGWKQIDGGGNIYNNTYTTEYYDNTYNITCSPTITTDTNNYLASTGDDTDRTGDIQSMLDSTGTCHLGPGDFYVTGIEIPDDASLIGSGPRTVLILDASVTDGYAVKLKTRSSVSDMLIKSLSAPKLSQNVGTRHGVLFEGTANAQTSPQTFKRSRVSGCIISNFTGGGITCRNTGLSPASSLVISDCQIFSCNAGVNISFFSEFHRITNVTAQECYYGCVCNGGNDNFVNCDFSANKIALLIDNSTGQSRNNTHGTFSACSFHHSDNTYNSSGGIESVGTAIRILGASAGEIFTGCQIGFGNLEIDNSVGIRFDACNFLRMTTLNVTNSPLVVFSDCTFYNSTSSPLIQSGNTTLKFADCYLRSGAVYDPTA